MKKLICVLLSLISVFCIAFTGCNAGTQNELHSRIDELQSQIEEMNDRLSKMQERIEQLEREQQDYVLKISADKQIYKSDEEILIDITLENRSGTDLEIAYYLLFYPESSTGQFPAYEQAPTTIKLTFKKGETISRTERLGGYFPIGHHDLKYSAVFYLTWEMTEFGWEETDDRVEVWSNSIQFTVTES